MNKNLHRIIFNARRGVRMAVAETAASHGKSASGQTRGAGALEAVGAGGLTALAFCAILLAPQTVFAQIKAEPRGPGTQQATVLTTANGVPQVNIQTPSAGGVSRNVFSQFDVQANGAVLNNSRTGSPSAVGGYVQANPWLAQGSARIILNEVNSSSASQLQGPIEVAGQRAEVIIANPAGISVNGGSFINASAVTLTTGASSLGDAGVGSYRVQGGSITINGKGLDTGGADYTSILARAVQINAGIWAKELHVQTGTGDSQAQATQGAMQGVAQAATQGGTGAGDMGVALDISALGGMYAGRIFLVGTEAGMGVRNAGTLTASAGDITISNTGWLSNAGTIHASGNTQVSTVGSQTHTGVTAAQGHLNLSATGSDGTITSTDKSVVAGGLQSNGSLSSSARTTINASQGATLAGSVIASGDLNLNGASVNLGGAHVQADNATITASAGQADLHADNASVNVTKTLTLATSQTLYTGGATIVAKTLNIGAHDLVNHKGTLGQTGNDDLRISLAGKLENGDGHIAGGGNVQLSSAGLTNTDKGSVYAGGKLDITTGQLANGGSIYAGGDLNLRVDAGVSNTGSSGLIASGGNTTITTTRLYNGAGASVVAGMQSDGKSVAGSATGGPSLTVSASNNLENQGNLSASGAIQFDSPDMLLGGTVSAGGNIGLIGNSVLIPGNLVTAHDLDVLAKSQFVVVGSGQVGGNAKIDTGSFRLSGLLTVNKDLSVNSAGIATDATSFLTVGHNATLNGASGVFLNGAATIGNRLGLSGKTVELNGPVDAGTTTVSGGTMTFGSAGAVTQWKGNLTLDMSGDVTARGGLTVLEGATINSGGTVHIGGNAQSGGVLAISASGDVQIDGTVNATSGAALTAGGTLNAASVQGTSVSLDAQQVTVTGSMTGTTGTTQLRGTNSITVSGNVSGAGGSGVIAITSGALEITGTTTSGAGMTLQAGSTIHLGQQTQASGSMHLQAGGDITADKGLAAGAVDIKAQNLSVAQNLYSGGVLQAQTHAFAVTGSVLSGGDTQIVATPVAGASGASTVHIGGALATTGALQVESSGTLQVGGSTQADGSLQLKGQGIQLGGKATSGGNSSIDAQGAALSVAGIVGSGGNQSLAGSTITVQGAQALGSMNLTASAGKIASSDSLLASTGLTANAAGAITVQGHIASDGATTLNSTGQVNASGAIASGAAGLTVDAGGDIAAANLQSLGNANLKSTANVTLGNALNIGSYTVAAGGNITQAQVQAGANLTETAGGGISHSGATLVQGDVQLSSATSQTLGSTPSAGLVATGSVTATAAHGGISVGSDLLANGNITTTANQGAISVGGNLATQGVVGAQAQNTITVGGALTGQSATLGSSAGGVQIASNVQVQTNLSLAGQTNVSAGGVTTAGGTLNASSTSGSVAFGNDLSVGTTTTIAAGNGITLGGNSKLVGTVQLQSTAGTISNQGLLATNQTLTVSGNADLVNHGSMQSVGDMNLATHNLTSNAGAASAITTAGALNANATGAVNLDNSVSVTAKTTITLGAAGGGSNAGNIQAGNAIALSGGTLGNSGQIASKTVSSTGSISNTGTVYGSDTVSVSGTTSNTGQIVATNSVSLGATTNSGVVQSQVVNLGSTSNAGYIAGNSVTASALANQGSVGATNDINVSGDVNNSAAIAANNINFTGGGTLVNSGEVHASGNIAINAGSFTNTAVVTAPIPGVPENTNIPYAQAGALKADGTLTITGGSVNNTGTLSSNGLLSIGVSGSVANNKRGFILGGGDISVAAGSVSNNGIVYGINNAPATITIAATGGVANGGTGVVIAGNQLNISASSFTNAGDNVSAGVGSLGNASLSTTGVWDAGSNPLKVNGLLSANTAGITVAAGKTWEQANVTWAGQLTNYGTVNLGIGSGAARNESTGVTVYNTAPDLVALAGSYTYTNTPPAGYTTPTLVGYTDVTNRAQFTAGSFTGSFANIGGDISGNINATLGNASITQATIWSGVPSATPGGAPQQIYVSNAKTLTRANLTANSVINLVGPSAGSVAGANVTINAGDLTVDKSNTGAAQAGIASAQGVSVGNINASPAVLALLQSPNLVNAAALHNAALQAAAQANATSSATVTATVGASAPAGTPSTFTAPTTAAGGATGAESGGRTLSLPTPDLTSVQGAFAALNAKKITTVVSDWRALGIQANAINTTNLQLNLSGKLTNGTSIGATSNLVINAAGGIDNSGGKLAAGEWVQLDSQGVGLINSGGTITAGKLQAKVQGDVNNDRGSITAQGVAAITATGDIAAQGGSFVSNTDNFVLLSDGNVVLADTKLSARNGLAAIQAKGNVTLGATTSTTTQTTSTATPAPAPTAAVVNDEVATVNHAAFDSSQSTTTTTAVKGSVVEGNAVVIQAGKDIDATAARITAQATSGATATPDAAAKQTANIPSGSVTLLAGGNINLRSGVNTTTSSSQELHIADTSNPDASRNSASSTDTRQTLAQTSISASNTLVLQADKRVDLSAVQISGDQGVGISAKDGVTLSAIALNNQSSNTTAQTQTNSANDFDGRVNAPITNTSSQTQSSLSHAGSSVTAQNGSVTINAASNGGKGNLLIESSNVKAAGNVNLQGQDVTITALQDRNQSQATTAITAPSGAFAWTSEQSTAQQSVRSSGASIQGGGNVSIIAATTALDGKTLIGGNATLQGANVQAGGDLTLAGANVRVSANVDILAAQASTDAANYTRGQTQTASGAKLQAGGKLDILAQANADTKDASQGNIVLNGATVSAGGAATLVAKRGDGQTQGQTGGGTITLGTVTLNNSSENASASSSSGFFSSSTTVERHSSTDTLQKGTTITANSITAQAAGDITGTNAQLGGVAVGDTKAGAVVLQSESGNVTLSATTDTHTRSDYRQSSSSGLFAGGGIIFGSRSSTDQSSSRANSAGVSSYGGDTVLIASGKNVTLTGTNVISDNGTRLSAKGDISIGALMTNSTTTESHQTQQSGLGTAGMGLFLGNNQQANSTTTQTTSANASTVGALKGNVTIDAGGTYTQTASSLQAPGGDITVTAKKIDIQAAQQTQTIHAEQSASSAGVSLTISNPVVSAVQGVNQTAQLAQATANVNDGRMKALGAATTALSAYNTANQVAAIAKDPSSASSIGINVSVGSSNSQATQDSTQTSSAGSSIAAGGNVKLSATGAGQDSNITLQGSTVNAGKNASLKADNQVNLLAATNTSSTANASSSSGSSLGVGFTLGSKSGFNITASANQASGSGQGSGTSYTASSIKAGNTASIQSGGDTNIIGSTVAANTVKADVGGNLTVTSLSDKNTYTESSQSSGVGVSLCLPPFCYGASSANVSAGKSAIDSNYQSTTTTAGIKAGDGGFQVDVKGATTLTGGQITSTQAAVDANKNSYASAGGTTTTDLQNSASYDASSMSVSAGMSGTIGDQSSTTAKNDMAAKGMTDKEIKTVAAIQTKPSGSAGVGSSSGSAASTTVAGITGIAGNKDVRTGDADASLKPIFDATQVRNDVNAQTQITASFGQMAPKAVGDYADRKLQEAINNQDAEGQAMWKEGGSARVALHTFVGGLSGGTPGAVGAATSQTVIPLVNDMLKDQNVPEPVRQGVVALAGAGIGAATGGTTGAATGFNATVNNFLNHEEATKRANLMAQQQACKDKVCTTNLQQQIDKLNELDNWRDQQIAQACQSPASASCGAWVAAINQAAASYTGKGDTNPLVTAERSSVLNDAFKYSQANKNPFLNGVGAGLLKLTPVGAPVSAAAGVYALLNSIVDNGLGDTAVNVAKGVVNLPAEMQARLNSSDPTVRGEALVDVLALGGSVTYVGTKLGQMGYAKLVDQAALSTKTTAPTVTTTGAGGTKIVYNGVELNPSLPPPVAGYDYTPTFVKGATTDNAAYAHLTGFQSEVKLANEVAGQGQAVVKWGDKIGSNGSDIISVNPKTGDVTLWDSKYRTATTSIDQSPTFANAGTRRDAIREAQDAIEASNLPQSVKDLAKANLRDGNITTNTVGAGGVKNSVQVRYCGNNPC